MDEVSIIELRQLSSQNVFGNGDWESILQEERILNPGDSVSIRNAFIDTKSSSSQTITIEDDLTVSIDNILYVYNWQNSDTKKVFYNNFTSTGEKRDGLHYTLCHYTPSGSLADFLRYDDIIMISDGTVKRTTPKFSLTVQYTDTANTSVTWHSDTFGPITTPGQQIKVPFNKIAKIDSVTITNQDDLNKIGILFDSFTTSPAGDGVFHPIVFTTNVTINAGTYDPDDIARFITDQLSVNNASRLFPESEIVNSSFLKNSDFFNSNSASSTATEGSPFIREDGLGAFQFTNNSGNWIGTNQISLEYDEVTQKFNWSQTHMPIYTSTNQAIITQFLSNQINAATPQDYFLANKNSGIAFTSLRPSSFWQDTLGFNIPDVCVNIQQELKDNVAIISGGGPLKAYVPVIDYVDGQTVTGSFKGLDAAIQKNDSFFKVPTVPFSSTSSQNISIYAETAFGIAGVKSGYFLIEISNLVSSDVIGQNLKSRTISGIVSRYYSADSYTSGASDSAIPYIHQGSTSIPISSMRIRILNPDGTIPTEIGEDNTVFLQVVKSQTNNN